MNKMFTADTLTFQELMAREKLPLATIQNAVLEFLRGRNDVAVFGAQAVNAYVKEPRMTQDVDLLSQRAEEFAKELQSHLNEKFHIAVRLREIGEGKGFRLYQVQKAGNRHLVDIRPVKSLPPTKRIAKILVVVPAELIAGKVIAYHQRRGKPKSAAAGCSSCCGNAVSRSKGCRSRTVRSPMASMCCCADTIGTHADEYRERFLGY